MTVTRGYFPDQRLHGATAHRLPTSVDKVHHFVNLTNGLEAVPTLKRIGAQIHMCRLQSSHCESSRPDLLLSSVDASMLFWLAQGHTVLVYDYGSRNKKRGVPRAIWYGLEFLKYVLNKVWYNTRETHCYLRGVNTVNMFEDLLKTVEKGTMKRIKYYRQYTGDSKFVSLYGVYNSTTRDADASFYQEMALETMHVPIEADKADSFARALALDEPFTAAHAGLGCHPIEDVLGMRLFLGGLSPEDFQNYTRV